MTAIGRLKTRAEFLHVRGGARFTSPSLVLQARKRTRRAERAPLRPVRLHRDQGALAERFCAIGRGGGSKEAVRLAAPDHAVEGYDYVLIAREGTVQRRFTELIKDLERALAKVHEPSSAKKR